MGLGKNTTYNILGALVPLFVTLVTLPIYLPAIGESRYGVLTVVLIMLGYFGLFDLGLGRAVTQRMAANQSDDADVERKIFWTALLINLGVGLFIGIVIWAAGWSLIQYYSDFPPQLLEELRGSLLYMALGFPLLLTSSILAGALMAKEAFFAQNIVKILEGVAIQLGTLGIALWVSPTLPVLVCTILLVKIISALALFVLCIRQLKLGLKPSFSRAEVGPLFSFGGWVTVTSIVGPLMSTLDRIIIGRMAGAEAITYYNVPYMLASRISILPGSLSSALFPRFSAMSVEERKVLSAKTLEILTFVITALIIAGIVFMRPFLKVWLGDDFAAQSAPIGHIILLGLWANSLAYIPYSELQGKGRPDKVALIHLAELLPYLGLLWLALLQWGIIGAAYVWTLRVWADAALLFRANKHEQYRYMLQCLVALAVAFCAVKLVDMPVWGWVLATVVCYPVIMYWLWRQLSMEVKATIGEFIRKIIGRLR